MVGRGGGMGGEGGGEIATIFKYVNFLAKQAYIK